MTIGVVVMMAASMVSDERGVDGVGKESGGGDDVAVVIKKMTAGENGCGGDNGGDQGWVQVKATLLN